MFRNNYQGGAVVEIFSGQGKDPVAKWKLCGGPSAIRKEYNKEVKGFVYCLEGSSQILYTTRFQSLTAVTQEYNKEVKGFVYCLEGSSQTVKMQMPENGKMSLGLRQRFLVFQVNIPPFKDFSVELVVTDLEHLKRRLHLSTVHKELSATLLHAKIPFVGLKRNIWSTLCIDLASFTGELFKGFLTLDIITLFATCKVRRIFTMKTEPTRRSDDDMSLSGAGLMDSVPRSCQFPPDVSHVTQVLNMENLHNADMRAGLLSSDCGPDQSTPARSASHRRTRPQGVSHTASGSRVSGPPPQTANKSSSVSEGRDRSALIISNTGSSSTRMDRKVTVESQSTANLSENFSHGEPSHILLEGTPGGLQPHPPKDRVLDKLDSKKLWVHGARRERQTSSAPSDAVPWGHIQTSKTSEKCTSPSIRQESRQQPLTITERTQHLTADESSCSPAKEGSGAAPVTAEPLSSSICPGLSHDLQVCSSWESNEGSEPQLTLQEEVFTFLSQPHSPKRGQGQGDQEKMEMGNDQVQSKSGRRYEARPEDDFIGSESDEDNSYTTFQHQRTSVESNPATPRSLNTTIDVQLEVQTESQNVDQTAPNKLSPTTTSVQSQSSGRTEPAGIVPTRCLSPSVTPSRQGHKCGPCQSEVVKNSSVSLSRRLLQEVQLDDSIQHKEEEKDNTLKPVDSSDSSLHLLSSLQMHGDDEEELRMLASLKREQEEDECRASGLSASQIHQCNVSISMSSDDTSTWTHISTPANQGHHYQREMKPLLQSNPREWMDVLSPPIMPPSQQRRSGNTWNDQENVIGGGDESVNEEENEEDEYLNLLYDPCLNCYFDPKTGKYYELA